MQVNFNTGAKAPRLPCISPNCKICDFHMLIPKKETTVEIPTEKPEIQTNWVSQVPEGLIPHFAYVSTPTRIY